MTQATRWAAKRAGLPVGLALLAVAMSTPATAAAQAAPSPAAAAVAAATGSQVRFEAAQGAIVQAVDGRYVDTLEVRRAPGGDLVVVNELPMADYVAGIAEMPTRWPLEALKAQAVAARTYAWFELEQGRWRRFGYDVCATTSCQVFRGAEVVETLLTGQNWREAVEQTEGQVLVFDDEPILARYFSTSGGRTWDNEVVFPDEGSYPYLKGVEDPDDEVSPLHRWQLRFTREQFDTLLSRGRTLGAASPMATIVAVPDVVPGRVRAVVATGVDGTVVEVDPIDFRAFVAGVAESLWPDDFPGRRLDGSGPLPTTMPSSRFTFEVTDDEVVINGSGWGHGVGMGQYGARGKADRGLDHVEILRTYYGGLEPVVHPGVPERIRVGLAALRDEVPVRLDGPARLVIGDQVVTERALGTWFVQDGPGREVSVLPPDGFGEPLEVAPTSTSRTAPNEIEIVQLQTRVNKPVQLRLDVHDLEGQLISSTELGVHERGTATVAWSLDGVARQSLPPGTYDVELVATDETGTSDGTAVAVSIRPFVAGEGDGRLPATVWAGARTAGQARVLQPVWLVLALAAGVAVGRAVGASAARRRTARLAVAP